MYLSFVNLNFPLGPLARGIVGLQEGGHREETRFVEFVFAR